MACSLIPPWRQIPLALPGVGRTAPDVLVLSKGHWWRQTADSNPSVGGLAPSLSVHWEAGKQSFTVSTNTAAIWSIMIVMSRFFFYIQYTLDIALYITTTYTTAITSCISISSDTQEPTFHAIINSCQLLLLQGSWLQTSCIVRYFKLVEHFHIWLVDAYKQIF